MTKYNFGSNYKDNACLLTPLPSFVCFEDRSLISISNVLSRLWANVGVSKAAFSPFITVMNKIRTEELAMKMFYIQF
jgi:hypothetical protein